MQKVITMPNVVFPSSMFPFPKVAAADPADILAPEPGDIGVGNGTLHIMTSRKGFDPFTRLGLIIMARLNAFMRLVSHRSDTSWSRSIEKSSFHIFQCLQRSTEGLTKNKRQQSQSTWNQFRQNQLPDIPDRFCLPLRLCTPAF